MEGECGKGILSKVRKAGGFLHETTGMAVPEMQLRLLRGLLAEARECLQEARVPRLRGGDGSVGESRADARTWRDRGDSIAWQIAWDSRESPLDQQETAVRAQLRNLLETDLCGSQYSTYGDPERDGRGFIPSEGGCRRRPGRGLRGCAQTRVRGRFPGISPSDNHGPSCSSTLGN